MNRKSKAILAIIVLCLPFVVHAQKIVPVSTLEARTIIELPHGNDYVLVDGRTVSMYNQAHIEGAILINAYLDDAAEKLNPLLAKDTIMIYCTTNSRTRVLTNLLKEAAYPGTIITVTDGIKAWIKEEYPVVVLEEPVQFE
jgi:rhodanese-related sulfurtransferase